MIAVDTNIIVRLIVDDDRDQVERALALAQREAFYVSLTVLSETEWVLRSRYGYERTAIVAALRLLPEMVTIVHEDPRVAWAIDRYEKGGEFADYLHLLAAREIGRFATFEKKLARRAEGTDIAIEIPA